MDTKVLKITLISLFCFSSTYVVAADSYYYCTVLAKTSQGFKNVYMKTIQKADGYGPKQEKAMIEAYVEYNKQAHPDYYEGYRANSDPRFVDIEIKGATQCLGGYTSADQARKALNNDINQRLERNKRIAAGGSMKVDPVVTDEGFKYSQ